MDGQDTMSVRAAARTLGVHENTIRNWMDRGWLDYRQLPSGFRRPLVESVRHSHERSAPMSDAMMDRPAYDLVRLLEAELDDGDQVTDSPERPNRMNIWAIREILEAFGGKRHRWSHPRCSECDHTVGFHHDWGGCDICSGLVKISAIGGPGCQLTRKEVMLGRDEDTDAAIEQAVGEWYDGHDAITGEEI